MLTPLALKIEKEFLTQGIWWPREGDKGKETVSPIRRSERTQSANILILAQ